MKVVEGMLRGGIEMIEWFFDEKYEYEDSLYVIVDVIIKSDSDWVMFDGGFMDVVDEGDDGSMVEGWWKEKRFVVMLLQ